jgi:hypothetical protein
MMAATNVNIPEKVSFAIRASIVTGALNANSVAYAAGSATQMMQSADLADQAKSLTAFIECQ